MLQKKRRLIRDGWAGQPVSSTSGQGTTLTITSPVVLPKAESGPFPIFDKTYGEGQDAPDTFSRGSTRTVYRDSLLRNVAVDTPAYDDNGLNLDVASTNICLQSEDFSTTWSPQNVAVTTDDTTAPDNAQTADAVIEAVGVNQLHAVFQDTSKAASSIQYTATIFVKENGRSRMEMRGSSGPNVALSGVYDLVALTTGTTSTQGSGFTADEVSIEDIGNGWRRCRFTFTTNTATSFRFRAVLADDSDQTSYDGDGTSGLYFWGAQVEQSSYPTSYIPTTAASVSRSRCDARESIAIGSEATIEWRGYVPSAADQADGARLIEFGGDANNNISLRLNASKQVVLDNRVGGVSQLLSSTVVPLATENVIQIKAKTNDWALKVNGTEVTSAVLGALPAGLANLFHAGDVAQGNAAALTVGRLSVWNNAAAYAGLS